DYGGELAEAVTAGRLREFAHFEAFRDREARQHIPDPVLAETFAAARLNWGERLAGEHAVWWNLFRDLLALRRRHVVPLLAPAAPGTEGTGAARTAAEIRQHGERTFQVRWHLHGGTCYSLLANLGDQPAGTVADPPPGELLYATPGPGGVPASGPPGPWTT